MDKGTEREKEIWENTFVEKIFWKFLLFNSLVHYPHTKPKLKFKYQKSQNKQK